MITDRKMHEDKARSWIIETPLQYMTKKKKKKKTTRNWKSNHVSPLQKSNEHDTHIKIS
jgi:hypothetical protein